jgi:hypothetical protein
MGFLTATAAFTKGLFCGRGGAARLYGWRGKWGLGSDTPRTGSLTVKQYTDGALTRAKQKSKSQ